MKIGIDARLWNETGVGRYIRNLVWELAKIDTKNSYILFFKKNEFENVETPGKNFEKRLADIHWHTIGEQTQLPSILKKEQLDLVHFPYFSVPILYTKPFIVTIHDLIINHFPTGKASTKSLFIYWIKYVLYKQIIRKAITHAKKIIAVSEATKQEIESHYPVKKEDIIVTYEGVDKKITSHQKRIIQEKYFLYVGNGYPHKNLERLVEAWKIYKQNDTTTKLVLVGKEDYFYKRLKTFIEKRKISNILFYEKISDASLASLYEHAIALVLPSLMEGFGLPVLEAMANKCLVVCSNIPSLKEVCNNAAVYFDPNNIENIADNLEKIIHMPHETKKNYIESGLHIAKTFSWAKMAKETLQVYESSVSI